MNKVKAMQRLAYLVKIAKAVWANEFHVRFDSNGNRVLLECKGGTQPIPVAYYKLYEPRYGRNDTCITVNQRAAEHYRYFQTVLSWFV